MTKNRKVVLKLGGSLMDCVPNLVHQIDIHAREAGQSVLIVPGGAVFADNVRRFQKTFGISEDAAHWMAVLAMEQYGYYLADRTGMKFTQNLEPVETGTRILMPYNLLRSEDCDLDHSWDVTSDTIAAWVAQQRDSRFIKATDVDGIYQNGELIPEIYAGDLVGLTCVDRGLPPFLAAHEMDCLVVNGKYPGRVIAALGGDSRAGTLIMGRTSYKSE